MSGGHFNYNQCLITEIADIIALEIARALLPKPQKVHEDYWTIDEHDCPLGHHNYPYYADVLELNEETIGTMKQAYLQIRKAYVNAQRVDWMLSGDDGEDDLQSRLKDELDEVQQEFDNKAWTCPFDGMKMNNIMKIQYMSDLHIEFAENNRYLKNVEFPVTGDILVLAGDSFYLNNITAPLSKFWKWASANYKQVLLVPGNHEYYQGCDIMDRGLQWRWMFKENVGYYQNQVVRIDDTDFILSTLWSHVPPVYEYIVSRGLNDFYQTKFNGKRLTVEDYNRLHDFCLDFIKKSVAESTAKHIVVVSHHLPTLKVVAAQHLGSDLNSAFATELGDFIADSRIDVWIYGHSHTNIDTVIGNTKIISNQMGYVFENEHLRNGFDAGKFVEIS